MKKVLVAGAALMLAGSISAPVVASAAEPGVAITGDARARYIYKENRVFGQQNEDGQTGMDSRIRLNITGTAAGGAYAKARLRLADSWGEDIDTDNSGRKNLSSDNVWVDIAYIGIPFNENLTVETGRYRVTYGPDTKTSKTNFMYDDVNLAGVRGVVKFDRVEINPFVEWMAEAQNSGSGQDRIDDNDEMRYGGHLRANINENWALGVLAGWNNDSRLEDAVWNQHDGFFGSIYINGKMENFGVKAEFAYTEAAINGFNNWRDDGTRAGAIGSEDDGYGGYIMPYFEKDALTIGLNLGFTADGFIPDFNFGWMMIGSEEPIRAMSVGEGGDWLWAGLTVNYAQSDKLKLIGNLVYADIDAYDVFGPNGQGPTVSSFNAYQELEDLWEISGGFQYTISKGLDFSWYAGYLQPSFAYGSDDGYFGSYAKFDLKF